VNIRLHHSTSQAFLRLPRNKEKFSELVAKTVCLIEPGRSLVRQYPESREVFAYPLGQAGGTRDPAAKSGSMTTYARPVVIHLRSRASGISACFP
jgi:hypothetical protein